MLEHTIRRSGFFKYLYREVERHICHRRYYSAAMLLEEVKRVRDCLANQDRTRMHLYVLGFTFVY